MNLKKIVLTFEKVFFKIFQNKQNVANFGYIFVARYSTEEFSGFLNAQFDADIFDFNAKQVFSKLQ